MDLDDLTPAGSGSLRDGTHRIARQTVATFTPTRTMHPDQIWNPRSREIYGHRPWRAGSTDDRRTDGHAGRFSHEDAGRTVRAALRPVV
jgi:hypothetical protein